MKYHDLTMNLHKDYMFHEDTTESDSSEYMHEYVLTKHAVLSARLPKLSNPPCKERICLVDEIHCVEDRPVRGSGTRGNPATRT